MRIPKSQKQIKKRVPSFARCEIRNEKEQQTVDLQK